jgi:hypothetical protein
MTGRQGFHGDLTVAQILSQYISVEESEKLTNTVFMGMGEPLDNYDNVIKFLRLVNMQDGLGISYRNISVSTCGIVPKILSLAEEGCPITLSISLHAPDDATRSEIMPINNAWGVSALLTACNTYFEKTGRRISFEYTLIAGKNDSPAEAEKLAYVLKKHLKNGVERFLQASIILPAVTEAISILRREEMIEADEDEPQYRGTVWADSILHALRGIGIEELASCNRSDYELANLILGNVVGDAISNPMQKLTDWSTIRQEDESL